MVTRLRSRALRSGRRQAGRFRQDLYYRLRVIEIGMPPLGDRPDDVLPMARRSLAETAGRLNLPVTGLAPRAADLLVQWSWPGNSPRLHRNATAQTEKEQNRYSIRTR